jgi:hypothetical protein
MEAAYISALSALAGSAIGGFTSIVSAWLSNHAQIKSQQTIQEVTKRETLYAQFIEEASRLFIDAIGHEMQDLQQIAKLYMLVSRMRLFSSSSIVEEAEKVLELIAETYASPNRTFDEIRGEVRANQMDPLRAFGEACRKELKTIQPSAELRRSFNVVSAR